MREILFRGMTYVLGEYKWVYGDLIRYHRTRTQYIQEEGSSTLRLINPESIGQYTGLQDKNGVRIFEGDIVVDKQEHRIANADPEYAALMDDDIGDIYSQIVFCDGAFMLLEPGCAPEIYLADSASDIEVVGNVYENKENWRWSR